MYGPYEDIKPFSLFNSDITVARATNFASRGLDTMSIAYMMQTDAIYASQLPTIETEWMD